MRPPTGLMGATWLFWGWQTGHLVPGVAIGAAVEAARRIPVHWALEDDDYNRLWDILGVVFIAVALIFLNAAEGSDRIGFLHWIPVIYLPMLAAQWWGPREQISYRTISWTARWWSRARPAGTPPGEFDITWPCWALCLVGASSAGGAAGGFYAGFGILTGWALWSTRPRRWPWPVWIALFAAVWGIGLAGHIRLHQWQSYVERSVARWIGRWLTGSRMEGTTAIGRIGEIKPSRRIVYRVKVQGGVAPRLIRQAAYLTYHSGVWYGAEGGYRPMAQGATNEWLVTRTPLTRTGSVVRIEGRLPRGAGYLGVPPGTVQVCGLDDALLSTNRTGTIRIDSAPTFVHYTTLTGEETDIGWGGETADLAPAPMPERRVFADVVGELGLAGLDTDGKLAAVRRFFLKDFRYTLWQRDPGWREWRMRAPLDRFLRVTKAGHCEYFATATVLLLRQAGVPARYVTGYVVEESVRRGEYLVRDCHAHAWCMVRRNGAWEDFDTTPSVWLDEEEAARASSFGWLKDAWAWLRFSFAALSESDEFSRRYVWWILGLAVLWLGRRLLFRRRGGRKPGKEGAAQTDMAVRRPSPLQPAEEWLAHLGFAREACETPARWLERIAPAAPVSVAPLRSLLPEAYRCLYDPGDEIARLQDQVRARVGDWVRSHRGRLRHPRS